MANPPSSSAITEVFAAIARTPAAQALARRVEAGEVLSLPGISEAAQPFFAAMLRQICPNRPIIVVTSGTKEQERVQQDVETWLAAQGAGGGEQVKSNSAAGSLRPAPCPPLFYPAWDTLPHEAKLPHSDVISERLETLVALAQHAARGTRDAPMVVTTTAALMQRTFPPAELIARTRTLRRGDSISPLDLVEWLEDQGYEPETKISQKGELSLRGGILDVFPPTSPWPVRLEFFGDELESLRFFDPGSQISREETAEITIPPAGELGLLKRAVAASQRASGILPEEPTPPRPPAMDGTAGKIPAAHCRLATFLEHLPRSAIFLLCQPEALAHHAGTYAAQIPVGDPFHITWEELVDALAQSGFTRLELGEPDELPAATALPDLDDRLVEPLRIERTDDLSLPSLDAFRPLGERAPELAVAEAQRREFFAQLHRWLRQGFAVHVFCNNDGERQRFSEVWKEHGFEPLVPTLHLGTLSRGFLCAEAKTVVVTDAEIFGRYKIQRSRRLKSPHAIAVKSALDIDFTELAEGDYVVHLQHGVGRYRGLRFLDRSRGKDADDDAGAGRVEHLVIEYAAADPAHEPPLLYVPVTEAHLISKYVGAGKARPPLNTLGGKRWQKTKEQAERAVRDLAAELLSIQAARETQEGHPFKADAPWQREFESAFIFEETADQQRAIDETKRDMERPKPMDRLICGDVGFGKTEVAIRAAFKAVMDGRQVAILVPTTVLAQQHFNTFRERMADYPVRIELLSRFRTRREQEQVIASLGAGAVDIVIGTHRLVQEDVHFKDLGLVIVDEEQRFGVMHKEKFKLLRKLVDVLTLSATPIPRTLYLALTGARDMSTIQTPPHDRLPVETIVTHYDERLIRDAIQRELNREGQVFFLHNRVETIEAMRHKLRELVPHARIVVGHGQMNSDDLEEVMTKFVNGEADVLLSTTIIESGLDIPNANTLIIDRADRFGLSQLYQLRGRVGRYKHQAFAYLMLPRHARLLSDVRKRMSALKQYSTLGSGFKIAMRDLEIRGAGNLLGAQQSGHITAVGFDLYCQLLKQSVSALKGEKVKPRVEVQVRLDFLAVGVETSVNLAPNAPASAHLPLNYISEPQQRIEIYRKLAQAEDKDAIESLRAELRDRFGPLPRPADLLLLVAELRCLASERAVTVLETRDDKLMLTRHGDFVQLGGKFPRLTKKTAEARLKEIKKLLLAL